MDMSGSWHMRRPPSLGERLAEDSAHQKVDVLGEQAEQQAHEEVRGSARFISPFPQALSDLGKLPRCSLRDLCRCLLGSQPVRISEQRAQHFQGCQSTWTQWRACQQVSQVEGIHHLYRHGKGGMHLKAVEIGHDQEWRVLQVPPVVQQLLLCSGEVFVLALVLPCEAVLEPHTSKAAPSTGLLDALLKCIEGPLGSAAAGCD